MHFNRRLWAFTKGFRGWLAFSVVFGLLTAAAGVARLALSGYAVALALQGKPGTDIAYAVAGVVVAILVRSLCQYLKEMTGHRTALAIQVQMRRTVYAKALELGPGTLDQKRTGDLLVSLVEGIEHLETYFGEYLTQVFVAALTPVGLFIFMVFFDIQTAAIYLLFALFTLVAPAAFHGWNADSAMVRRRAYGDLSAEFLDSVQGLATLKAFGQSRARGTLLAEKARHVYRSTMGILAANIGTTGVTWFGIMAGAAVALGWGAVRVDNGTLDLTALLMVVMLGVEVFRPLRELTTLYHRGMLGMASATAVFDLLDTEPQVKDVEPTSHLPRPLEPSLEFQNVTFTYPTREMAALNEVSFTVNPGETVAVVGPSGAGKSTLVWLALRFFDTSEGKVLIGGQDARELPLSLVREQVAVVTQDTYLFHGTVADNLRFGKPEATQEELETAARIANAHDFIAALPDGYDTLIGERGIKLSGGQRQRVAIARALLKDAAILILDEALSSVDAESEAVIQEALNRLMKGRTTMVIAHRLSSVINADRTIVLDDGRLVEEGPHDSLLRLNGVYSRLMAAQVQAAPEGLDDKVVVAGSPQPAARIADLGAQLAGHRDSAEAVQPAPGTVTPDAQSMGWLRIFARLLDLVKPWRGQLTLTFLLGVLRVFVLVGIGVTSGLIVRQVAVGGDLIWLLVSLGIMAALTPLLHWGESWMAHDLAFRLLAEMRIDMYDKLDRLAPAYLVRRRSGDIISAATTDVEAIELFFAHTIAPAFVAVIVPGSILVTMAVFHWPLALVLMPFLVLVAYTPFQARKALDRLGYESRQQLGEANAHMVDSLQGMREIVSFGREGTQLEEVTRLQRRFNAHRLRFFHALTIQRVLIEMSMGLGGLSVLAAGAYFVTQGSLSANVLPLMSIIALASFIPVSEVAQVGRQLADTLGSSRRVFAVHDEPIPVTDGEGVDLPEGYVGGAVQFQDVRFAYGPDLPQALREISFAIRPGQTIALVGRSGAGKTTTAHLLLRFWDPLEGGVSLDSHDLKDFCVDDLRQRIALVAQDTYLFNTTVRDNLKLAKPDATEAEMVEAVKQAAAHEFISGLPQGYDTPVGEHGFQLSGGQRQRIAIARAFLKSAPVLVLDEATSHLDAESEGLIHQALSSLTEGRTTLLIAHRLSTVRDADKIVALEDGRVVDVGDHEELIARGGLYSQLVSAQMLSQRPPGDGA